MSSNIDLKDAIKEVSDNVDQLNQFLKPLTAAPLPETLSKFSPEERAQLQVILAYSINTLYWTYLKINGIPPTSHPVMKELVSWYYFGRPSNG
ncbi:hypothetical protein BJ085DRAFT_13941 [Dimargaris cristalligena]|uniref:Exosome complex protein n=1 Tax=Dimargaris cristalligena TaxID=215637 RepID=A0A4P9ZJN1_9FUNG|nr:hypothetical protein BJ085DRAFT_13941 [Dimargaris cristalligena]|eukprot:RKP33424.1 hypothetical protein BJ085DRAFT_13941 [Dimargaris cristalligena]